MNLRPYQSAALDATRDLLRSGCRRVLIVSPTGSGKTVIFAAMATGAVKRGSRVWFIAHRRELIKQSFCKLVHAGVEPRDVGVILGGTKHASGELYTTGVETDDELFALHGRRRPHAFLQTCSVDSLRSRLSGDVPATSRAEADQMGHPNVVVIDEAHRALAPGYRRLQELYPFATFIGLTATPYRGDRRGLGELFDEMVVVAQPPELIEAGHLVRPVIYTVPHDALPDLTGIKVKGGDYDEKQLSAAMQSGGLVGDLVEHWEKKANWRRTVVFACDVEHSKAIAQRFRDKGITAEHLDGKTPVPEREAILARLGRGETHVVSNVGVLTEGWDMPSVKCCVLARPTKSTGLYLQMAGRILRPWQDVGALILDHAGCVLEHGAPDAERDFSLDAKKGDKKSGGTNEAPTRVCEVCFAISAAASKTCEQCGEPFPVPERLTEESAGELVEFVPPSAEEQAEFYKQLLLVAEQKGYKPGWAFFRFQQRFPGQRPPAALRPPTEKRLDASPEERLEFFADLVSKQRDRGYADGWVSIRFKERFGSWPSSELWERFAA